ncbi:MAG: DinB family protein [Saprospiraceae bacterium]
MDSNLKQILWGQFGGCIDMLKNAITACDERDWNQPSQFWYNAYHCLFYLDYYLSEDAASFAPPPPFGFSEFDPSGAMPERVYTKEELLNYVHHCRSKCKALIAGLNEENAAKRFVNDYRDYSRVEILIYNMRHVQHHVGQLNLILRQQADIGAGWVSRTEESLF